MNAYRDDYAREQMTEVITDAISGKTDLAPSMELVVKGFAEAAVTALIEFYGEPTMETRTRGGYRMDSRWTEHRLEFPWKDGTP